MTPKAPDTGLAKSGSQPPTAETGKPARKAWKKKSPEDVIIDQVERLRTDVSTKEQELKKAKSQLAKLEEVAKVLGSQ
jgi:hypothetical protein